jgi:two-component system cell cycle sensor histidine kinase/response regulator CckA
MSNRRVIVHDLKNHLGIVIGYANLLLDEMPHDDPRRADIDEIRKAGENALAVVEQLRAMPDVDAT